MACLVAAVGTPLGLNQLSQRGLNFAGASQAQSLLAILYARSPGERDKGALVQTKVKPRLAEVPRERALGKVFPPSPAIEQLAKVVVSTSPVAPPSTVGGVPFTPSIASDILLPANNRISGAPPVIGTAVVGGSFPSPPTSTAPPNNVSPPTEVTSAVPEPGSWLMMLLGFGVVGAALSRRRKHGSLIA